MAFWTKREAVERGLRSLDVEPLSREEILELEGMGWDGDLDEMREDAPAVRSWAERGEPDRLLGVDRAVPRHA